MLLKRRIFAYLRCLGSHTTSFHWILTNYNSGIGVIDVKRFNVQYSFQINSYQLRKGESAFLHPCIACYWYPLNRYRFSDRRSLPTWASDSILHRRHSAYHPILRTDSFSLRVVTPSNVLNYRGGVYSLGCAKRIARAHAAGVRKSRRRTGDQAQMAS